jgi:N4-gp56 family major capsid protein
MAYSPAGNLTTSAGLGHLQQVYYKKKALSRLQKKFKFRMACMMDSIPRMSGRTVQWYRYSNFTANTTPTTEGTVGTSLSLTSKPVSATVSQFTSFITVSDFLKDTAIDPILTQASDLLGYQGGLSVDTITRNLIDSASASVTQNLIGTYAKVADLRNYRSQLAAVDVEPIENDEYLVILHPFIAYDIVNDPAAGGLADIFKYNTDVSKTPLVRYEDRGTLTHIAGCKVVESTNVLVTAGTPNTYRMYAFGLDGIGCVDLEGRGPAQVIDPKKQRFNISVVQGGTPSIPDPEGVIGGAVSYNYIYTAAILDGPAGIGGTYRYRITDAASSIG